MVMKNFILFYTFQDVGSSGACLARHFSFTLKIYQVLKENKTVFLEYLNLIENMIMREHHEQNFRPHNVYRFFF